MSAPDFDPQLASDAARQNKLAIENVVGEVARLRQQIIEHNARFMRTLNWMGSAWFIAGIVVGVGGLFLELLSPDWCFVSGVATFLFGLIFSGFLLPRPPANFHAKCPQCEYDWVPPTITVRKGGHNWLTWKCCPGCGLKMSDADGGHVKR